MSLEKKGIVIKSKTVCIRWFILKEFKSVKEAASFMKCSSSLISGACNGKLKHAKGFKWKYTEGSSK